MKKLILLTSLLFVINFGFSQNLNDSTLMSNQELLNISNHIKDLEDKIKIKDDIIDELENQVYYYKQLQKNDSIMNYLHRQEIAAMNVQVAAYKNLYDATKPKWYNGKFMGFIYGAGTIMGASWVVNNIK